MENGPAPQLQRNPVTEDSPPCWFCPPLDPLPLPAAPASCSAGLALPLYPAFTRKPALASSLSPEALFTFKATLHTAQGAPSPTLPSPGVQGFSARLVQAWAWLHSPARNLEASPLHVPSLLACSLA